MSKVPRVPRPLLGLAVAVVLLGLAAPTWVRTQLPPPLAVEGQALGENVKRVLQALEFLGTPLAVDTAKALQQAAQARDGVALQKLLDPHVLVVVSLSPEARVKAARGPAQVALQQGGYLPVLL